MYAIRLTIDDKKLLEELRTKSNAKAAKQKGTTGKPSFMERLQKMQYEQEKARKEMAKKKKK